ncbi:MAG: site-2 protease family protein [candidate division Zixibacteria bacterium]|nr:site-2 protease family protein [candidate division Zixibacteria bacterium]
MDTFDRTEKAIAALLHDLFEIGAVYRRGNNVAVSLGFRFNREKSLTLLEDRLKTAGYRYTLTETGDALLLSVDPTPRMTIPPLNIILFIATLFTVYFVPVFLRRWAVAPGLGRAFDDTIDALAAGEGIEFTIAMISILFVHEMGHYLASRRRNIITSWPYFIPAPNIIGTFGAVIKSKSPFWNRRDLIEVGAAGPIAGWVVALGWLWYGLSQSALLPQTAFSPMDLVFSMDGESIIMRLSTLSIIGSAPAGYFYKLTEAAFAGWVGLLVTAINMLPIGQLDGGHVVYGLVRRRQHLLGKLATAGLILFGLFGSTMWWFFAAFGLFFGMSHPPTIDDRQPLSPTAVAMGWTALVILVVSFTPVPFR